jgi:transposase
VVTGAGACLETHTVNADLDGYAALVELAEAHSPVRAWAIEGTGSYGAGLVRHLRARGEWVIELDRPQRPARRHGAKSDVIDAERAARDALARHDHGEPRAGGRRAALAALLIARRSAVQAAGDAQRQLQALIVTAPECLRGRFVGQSTTAMVTTAARLRVSSSWDLETRTTAGVLRSLARRSLELTDEIDTHTQAMHAIIEDWRPDLLAVTGVGPVVAAVILCAWSHPGRIRDDAAFAMLAGACPIPASSGLTNRHRLNRSGDRQLNRALHVIAITRLRHDPATRAYAARRRTEGKTDREIRRCLKRYIARQLYRQLEAAPTTP